MTVQTSFKTMAAAALAAMTMIAAPALAGESAGEGGAADASASRHCSPRVAQMCDALPKLAGIDEATWKAAAYGATICAQSVYIETERKRRRDRVEYEASRVKAAKEAGEEYTPWEPAESNAAFNARTTQQCTEGFAFYCGEMKKEAGKLVGESGQEATALLNSVCPAETSSAQ